ncbi:hypothetical protein FGKAn22_08870 [Ferrigenium kumadai]|uniref:Uncharacterized protein n=1 Tax=Ferrigenium kumadai TaxID=1682490 RepID=A0AAN1T0M2_9PROT|nr:hypothetical protein [Ferrigenium kumadai]BBI99194.1 hypothetical protein FGKAn22_08870 [Ferrigenium kumadai]
MFNLFGEKPDHPMYDLDEARRLLAELPQDEPHKALDDVTFWLESIRDAAGFPAELRAAIVMLVDETMLTLYTEQLRQYLAAPHLQDFQGLHLWQGIHAYAKALAEAYGANMREYQQAEKKPVELREQMPLLCVRLMRAAAEQMKLELMRYVDVEPSVWQLLGDCQRFAEAEQCTGSMVHAYPGHVIHTSPQRELLRALVLYTSSPGTLAADQIEVAYRIAGRMVSFFDLKTEPAAECPYRIDLGVPLPPQHAESGPPPTADTRWFGAVRAKPAVDKIIDQNESDPAWQERRFGSEFTPGGKLTVLKHLSSYWAQQPPHRHLDRRGISVPIEVAHGFRVVSQVVTRIDLDTRTSLDNDEEAAARERAKVRLAATEDIKYTTEAWSVTDASADGLGATLSRSAGAWAKIGDLCGLKPQNGPLWWVAAIRRLHTDDKGTVHVGLDVLAKKPLSVWLRALGKGAEKASNWETSSGSFEYTYLPAILLPDAQNTYQHATMLMESGSYVNGNIYQALMGEKSRDIKLTSLIAEGEDYEQVGFEWLGGNA